MELSTGRRRSRTITGAVLRAIRLLLTPLARLIEAIDDRTARLPQLPPELVAALSAAEDATTGGRGLVGAVDDLETAFQWLGGHRDQLVELVGLIGAAVQIVETYDGLSGADKRRVVQQALAELFGDLGPMQTAALLRQGVEVASGAVIDAVVGMFNRRSMFGPP